MKLWWGCPEWLCRLFTSHARTKRWANYNTDQSGTRCACGRFFTDDYKPEVVHDERIR